MITPLLQGSVCALLCVWLAGCGQQPAVKPADQAARPTAAPQAAIVPPAGPALGPVQTADPACRSPLKFIAVTVYAGATDYYFESGDKTEIAYRVENDAAQAASFARLMVRGRGEPADANPAMIGKLFKVCEHGGAISLGAVE